ncbi:MAG: caspase family protein [Saprospiraceae bacterium]|nr:caspase family protein [Saprospiraceae bacterium]
MKNNPNLYALIVGIDDYQRPVSKLKGCVPDAQAIKKYLEEKEKDNFTLKIKTRFNQEATRTNVINDFQTHLAAATENDVILFFYAGHGAQEKADPSVWLSEPDQKLEGLVLYDSVPADFKNCKLLADKELRYLLNYVANKNEKGEKKKNPHIVVVTDCCHSGENTRGGEFDGEMLHRHYEPATTRGDGSLPARAWDDFLFAKVIDPKKLATQPINDIIPPARHVAMAACQSNELASEKGGHGVFTTHLIEILERSQGLVSYRDLQSRVKNYLKNQFPQVPQIYASTDSTDLYRLFLGKKGVSKPVSATVQCNEKDGWMMDMGAIHGISNQAKGVKVTSADGKISLDAAISKIETDHTFLTIADDSKLDKRGQYRGIIEGFLSAPIAVFIDNLDGNKEKETDLRDLIVSQGKNLNVVAKEDIADYAIRIFDGKYVITNRVDTDQKAKFKPIVLPSNDVALAFDDLNHISQYEFVKNLENTGSNKMSLDKVSIAFLEKGKTTPATIQNVKGKEIVELPYQGKDTEGIPTGSIQITVTSNDDKPLYVALLYLSPTFGIMTNMMSNNVQLLEKKGDKALAWDGEDITLTFETQTGVFNLPSSDTTMKLIISRQPFDVSMFQLDDLPSPMPLFETERGEGGTRGLQRVSTNTEAADAWATRTLLLRNPNPFYDKDYKNKPKNFDKWLNTEGSEFLKKLY